MHHWLIVVHTLELVALALWIGGLLVIIASVIPAVFNSFGMEQGGRFLTRVFDGYNRLVVVAILILLATATARLWMSRRNGAGEADLTRPELMLMTVMIVVAALIIVVLGPESVTRQEQAFTANGEAQRKAAYDAFFRIHMVVRGLYILNLGLGIALLVVKLKNWMKKGTLIT